MNQKTKTLTSLILAIIIFSTFTNVILLNESDPEKVTDLIAEDQTKVIDPINENDVSQTTAQDFTTIYQGETVKTDIEFNDQIYDTNDIMHDESVIQPDNFYIVGPANAYENDGSLNNWYYEFTGVASGSITTYFKIYCGGSGALNYDFAFRGYESGFYDGTGYQTGSLTVGSNWLDAKGYLSLSFHSFFSSATTVHTILKYSTTSSYYQIVATASVSATKATYDKLRIMVDQLSFQRDTITNNVRSEYKFTSETTIQHRLDVPSIQYAKELNIYYPEHWVYSSINPYASVTDSSYTLTVNSPTELTYNVLFISTSTNHLAIKDVSNNYLQDLGFETGAYSGDIAQQSGYEWDSISISTEQSFEGYYSVELENTVASRSIISIDAFEGRVKNFYFQISVYYETVTSGSLYIYYSSDSGWTNIAIDNTIVDRWQTVQLFIADAEYNGVKGYFRIDTLSGTNFEGKVYIDNIKILETSTTIETFGYSESEISSTLISWDGYKNPVMPYEILYLELWDRTEQILEESYSTITNENGIASWTLEKGLEQKEYELRVYTIDSYFGSAQTQIDVTNSLTYWTLGNEDPGTETISCVDSSIIFEFRESVSVNWEFRYNPTAQFDISSSDILYYTYRSNVSSGLTYNWIKTDASNHIINGTDQSFSANTIYHMVEYFRHSDYPETGTFDDTSIDLFYHRASLPLGWVKVEIFDFRFINTQKLYFTPSYPTHTDYAETVLGDAWDFSEDTDDIDFNYATESVDEGLLILTPDGAHNYVSSIITYDYSDYEALFVRLQLDFNSWAGTTNYIYLRMYDTDNDFIRQEITNILDNEWIDISLSPTNFDYESGTFDLEKSSHIRIQVWVTDGGNLAVDDFINIAYIKNVHIDSWLEETNDYATDDLLNTWDFEEYGTGTVLDHWQESVGGQTIELEDGCFKVDITSTDAYARLRAIDLSISASTYTRIIITIKTNEDNLRIMFAESGNQGITAVTDVGVANVFHTLVFDIDDTDWSGTETALYLWLYDSDGNFEGDEFFWIEEIRLVHLEEMPYTAIQNYAGLESESMDLFYNVWIDGYYFGVYQDPSLVPLITNTVGVHYISIQPFKIDSCYTTQQIFSYYYLVSVVDNYYTNLGYDYDLSGTINLIIKTLWANQTIDVWHNSTQLLNDEPEGDITTFYTVSESYHEITVKVYNGAELWDEFVFGFKIIVPDAEGNQIQVWNKDVDLAAGFISVNILTSWGNQSVRVKDNSTWLGDYTGEGASIWSFSPTYGFHNCSIWLFNGAEEVFVEYFSFTIVAPPEPEGLIIEVWKKDLDIAAGMIFVNVRTNWANQSIRVSDNGTWLGNYADEGASIWLFTLSYGFHNISIYLFNGAEEVFAECFSFTIQEPIISFHAVHFDIVTVTGVGLPFSTVKVTINDSRIYYPEQLYLENSYLIIKAYDFYGHLLFSTTETITESKDIIITVNFHEQMLVNNYAVPVEVTISAINEDPNLNLTYVIGKEGSITLYMLAESYNVYVEPLVDSVTNATHIIYYYPEESSYEDLGIVTAKSYSVKLTEIPKLLDTSAEQDLEKELFVYKYAFWIALFLDALMLAFATAILKWGLLRVLNTIIMPFMYAFSWFGFQPKILIRDEGGLRFIDLEQYQKLSKKEEEGVM